MVMTNVRPESDFFFDRFRAIPRHTYVIAGLTFFVLMLGGLATPLGPWYYGLEQPPWKAPDVLFGPAWTVLFILIGFAAIKAWRGSQTSELRLHVGLVFGLNGVLNVLWSVLFFTLERPDWALMEVGILWLSIVSMMAVGRSRSPAVVPALTPYLLWVSYAAALNAAVVRLNGPFG